MILTAPWHASKSGKVRIVFDCSANYDGTSLNNKLLSGPDQPVSLLGILLRFHTEEVVFMGDIEALYYHVQVLEGKRIVLRWEE